MKSVTPLALLLALVLPSTAFAQEAVPRYPRLYGVTYNPFLEAQNQRLHAACGWNNPDTLNAGYVGDYHAISHGLYKPRLTTVLNLDEFPLKIDGFRYTDASYWAIYTSGWNGAHQPDGVDYRMLARNHDLARRVDFGEIDEVLMHGAPYFGYWETNMHGFGGYWCNSGPTPRIASSRIYVVMGFNYERGVAEMLHDDGHRAESIMSYVYLFWDAGQRRHLWERFAANYGQTPGTSWGIGSCHIPFNADDHYDYADPRTVLSTAPLWETMGPGAFPELTGAPTPLSRTAWGGPDYHRNYLKWFFGHMPSFPGRNQQDGFDRLNNWWEYVFNYNAHSESGGDFEAAEEPPPAPAYRVDTVQLSTSIHDDWRPRINAANRVVWAGSDGLDTEIFSANADGTGLVRITTNGYADELPRINASARIVWQRFDGKVFQIWSVNADGTDLVQVTNSPFHQWQPAINDAGRIAWAGFDGTDYEIFSANADGSDLVQLTSDAQTFPDRPRDDLWPQITNAGKVVWRRYTGTSFQIYSANSDGTGLANVSNNAFDNEFPQVSPSGRIAWHAWISDSDADVFTAAGDGSPAVRVTTNNGLMDWWPQVNSAGELVWMQRGGPFEKWRIMARTAGGVVSTLTPDASHAQHPVLDDDGRIAWQGFDGTHWQISLWDGAAATQLTLGDFHSRAPALVTGSEIVWHGESYLGDPNSPGYKGPTTEIFATSSVPQNQPPTVDVGADQLVALPATAALAATVSDDGLPNPPGEVTLTWSQLSGPGTVTFGGPQAAETTAAFSSPGTYVLQLLAEDGGLEAADTLEAQIYLTGDLNCSGTVGFDDINPFVLAISNPGAWQVAYPGCPVPSGDINGDGWVSFSDINPFVSLLSGN